MGSIITQYVIMILPSEIHRCSHIHSKEMCWFESTLKHIKQHTVIHKYKAHHCQHAHTVSDHTAYRHTSTLCTFPHQSAVMYPFIHVFIYFEHVNITPWHEYHDSSIFLCLAANIIIVVVFSLSTFKSISVHLLTRLQSFGKYSCLLVCESAPAVVVVVSSTNM